MRKIKLQMQMTLDGFVAGPEGQLDWMWIGGQRDEAAFSRVIALAQSCDTILMGRKMARGFIDHWENVLDNMPDSPEQPLARLMVEMPKFIFSHTENTITGRNAAIENGDIVAAIQALKQKQGNDMMVYGGAGFASSLIEHNLVDEYYIFLNPVAIGKGLTIFNGQKLLKLEESTVYKSGKVLNKYLPA